MPYELADRRQHGMPPQVILCTSVKRDLDGIIPNILAGVAPIEEVLQRTVLPTDREVTVDPFFGGTADRVQRRSYCLYKDAQRSEEPSIEQHDDAVADWI
jgi:hypothetical protein